MPIDSIDVEKLRSFDFYFIGEQHYRGNSDSAQIKLIDKILAKSSAMVLLEWEYSINFILDTIFVNRDTSFYSPATFGDRRNINLIRYLYNKKTGVKGIDVLNLKQLNTQFIQGLYSKVSDSIVLSDLLTFEKIGPSKFYNKRKTRNKYLNFLNSFNKHTENHKIALGSDFNRVNEYFSALEAALLSAKDRKVRRPFISQYRENFLFSMVKGEVRNSQDLKIISRNGLLHIPLNKQKNWLYVKNWESAAAKTKKEFPDKKVCSVYGLLRGKDPTFEVDYYNEWVYIKEHTQPGKIYLINLEYHNSPFRNLLDKFNYILVY
jgi:hypothetical protein